MYAINMDFINERKLKHLLRLFLANPRETWKLTLWINIFYEAGTLEFPSGLECSLDVLNTYANNLLFWLSKKPLFTISYKVYLQYK